MRVPDKHRAVSHQQWTSTNRGPVCVKEATKEILRDMKPPQNRYVGYMYVCGVCAGVYVCVVFACVCCV